MCDQRLHLLRVVGDQLKPYEGTAAISEHECWFAADGHKQAMDVVSEGLDDPLVLWHNIELAAREASRVIRHDGVPVGKPVGNASECSGVRRPARDHEQHGP